LAVDKIEEFDGVIEKDGTVTVKGLDNLKRVYDILKNKRQPIIIKEKVGTKIYHSIVSQEEVMTSGGVKLRGVE